MFLITKTSFFRRAKFLQKLLKYNATSVPNHPNYRLGPLDGSPGDTLGLNNWPHAWYRYEQDSLDPLAVAFHDLSYYEPTTWSWDFGDGSIGSIQRHPQHHYASAASYEVCLTVSNINGTNTHCKTLYLGVSAQENPALQSQIRISPNPFADRLLVTLSTNLRSPVCRLYNMTGRLMHEERIVLGMNEINTNSLGAGIYFWKVMSNNDLIKSGKIIKINE